MEETRRPPATTSPELRVEVAVVLVCNKFPPEIVSPEAEERPPLVEIAIPPAKVEVPVPPSRIVEEAWKSPWTWKFELTVEEAEEIKPAWVVRSPPNTAVEEAFSLPEIARSPEWNAKPLNVEEALDRNPPVNVESPDTERVEPSWAVPDAENVEAALREPEVKREEAKVEEAVAKSPP
jgi:hypothetical protein